MTTEDTEDTEGKEGNQVPETYRFKTNFSVSSVPSVVKVFAENEELFL